MNEVERIADIFGPQQKGKRLIWNGFKPDGTKNQYWQNQNIDWEKHLSGELKQGGNLACDGMSKAWVIDIDQTIDSEKIGEDSWNVDNKAYPFLSPSKRWHIWKFWHKAISTKDIVEDRKRCEQLFKSKKYKIDYGHSLPKENGSLLGINFPFNDHQLPYDPRGMVLTRDQFIHRVRFQNYPLISAATGMKQGEGGRPTALLKIAALLEQKNKFQYLDDVIKNFGDEFTDTEYIKRIKEEGLHKKYINIGYKGLSEAISDVVGFDYKLKEPEHEPPPNLWEGSEEFEDIAFNKPTPPKKHKLEIITGDDIFFSEDVPINWAIENILPEGMCIIAALPKIGKSWLALQIAIAVENALEVLDFKVKKGRALYCAYEDNKKRIKRRFKTMGVKAEDKRPQFVFKSEKLTEGLEEQIESWIKETPDARLVVIDTYVRALPTKARKTFKERYEIDSQQLSELQRLALEYNITIIIIHHTTKGKQDDTFNEISGSVGVQAIADTLWVISSDRKTGKDSILEITGRDIESTSYQIGLDVNCKWLNKGRPGENLESEDEKQIIKAIKELNQEDGSYPRDVVAHLKLTDKTEIGNLKKRMKRMLNKNELMAGQKNGQYKNHIY
jgi:hypothetical protein